MPFPDYSYWGHEYSHLLGDSSCLPFAHTSHCHECYIYMSTAIMLFTTCFPSCMTVCLAVVPQIISHECVVALTSHKLLRVACSLLHAYDVQGQMDSTFTAGSSNSTSCPENGLMSVYQSDGHRPCGGAGQKTLISPSVMNSGEHLACT